MPETPATPPLRICASADLPERGKAVVFDVLQYREPARAFALRFDGQVVAYLNRCVHVPTEMDWQEGEFLDSDREFILCSIHGAAYDPRNGRCAAGPCGRGALTTLDVRERDGEVYWYPSRDTRQVPATPARAAEPSAEPAVNAPSLAPFSGAFSGAVSATVYASAAAPPAPVSFPVSVPVLPVQAPDTSPLPPSESNE